MRGNDVPQPNFCALRIELQLPVPVAVGPPTTQHPTHSTQRQLLPAQ